MNRYDLSKLADQLQHIVQVREQELRLEQAVYGLDWLAELKLHKLFADGLESSYCVAREVHYPSTAGRRLSHRERCDLVLTPHGRALRLDRAPADLFTPPELTSPEEALWLEIKVAWQFREGGARHSGYGAQWRQAIVADLRKMEQEPRITEAALLLVVFNESQEVLEKDLDLFETVLAQKEVLAGFRQVRSVPITERIGHRFCSVALWPTVQRGMETETT